MPHAENNPFSLVYSELWNMLEEKETFKDLVKLGNRIRYDKKEKRDPFKFNIATADLPELVLSVEGATPTLILNSSSSSIILRYAWMLSTGDLRVIEGLHGLEFVIFAAMVGWQEKITRLKWNDKTFVKLLEVSNVAQGMSDPERNRGIKGWSAIWSVDVTLIFTTQDLKDLP